jgi:hypothetical protein
MTGEVTITDVFLARREIMIVYATEVDFRTLGDDTNGCQHPVSTFIVGAVQGSVGGID